MDKEWEYYNHALVPATAPHVVPDISWMNSPKRWRELSGGRYPLLVRWVTDFDCQEETQWWYCIKDTPFDMSSLKYKRRRVINQGLQWVEVRQILPCEYAEQMAEINLAARLGYGEHPDIEEEKKMLAAEFALLSEEQMGNCEYTGAFLRETGRMIGYGIYEIFDEWVNQSVIKTHPDYLKYNVNAALAFYAVERYLGNDSSVRYLSNGAKNISHETNYHEYLMKYFGFRKAYCRLHIRYRVLLAAVVRLLYPFRELIYRRTKNGWIHNAASILRMEEIRRSF